MSAVTLGKAKIDIKVEGCIKCGTQWSSGWREVRTVPVKIGKWENAVSLNICANCDTEPFQMELGAPIEVDESPTVADQVQWAMEFIESFDECGMVITDPEMLRAEMYRLYGEERQEEHAED